jgi:ATPase subunit of ABC transporter with duplicated ATPase domains
MISFANINKQYGKQLLFVDASFQLNPGEKVGLVGPNGSGKTTLFRMVVGEETPDEGAVSVPKKLTIGYFRQDVEEMQGRSVLDEAIAGSGRVGDLHHELEALQREMSDHINPTTQIATALDNPREHGCPRRISFPGSSRPDPISPLLTSWTRCLGPRWAQLQVVTPGIRIKSAF